MYLVTRNSALLLLVNNKGADQPVMRKTKKKLQSQTNVPPRGSRQLKRGEGGSACRRADPDNSNRGGGGGVSVK